MSETNTAEIRVVADASGVEAGLQPAITAAQRAERAISGIGNNSVRSQQNLIAAIQRTTAQMEAGSRTSARYWEITARQRGVDPAILEPYLRQLRAVEEAQRRAAESAGDSAGGIERAFAVLRGGAVVAAIAAVVAPVVSAQREFDKLNSSLITATGSSDKAAVAFAALQSFAATTPYGVAEATEAFIKMRNLGLDPSERALRSYGNTAAAMGKDLNQMVEAVADAATGEFERLKEFGIKASQNGEKVTLTFKGTSTTIKNEAGEIEKYLMRIGEVDFASAMIQRAATLDGAISQLGDSWDSFLRSVSSSGVGDAARDGVDILSTALGNLEVILNAVSGAADKQKDSLFSLDTVNRAITIGLEAVTVLGLNTAYVFTQVRNEFVGLGKQALAVAKGDFAGARAIGEQMKVDADRDRKEVDRQTAAILGAVEKAKQAAAGAPKKAPGDDPLAQFRIQREAERESEAAAKRRADQLKRETAALAELAGLTSTFAAEWKMLSKLYADGKINLEGLTKAQADLLAKQPAMRAAAEQEVKARKEVEESNKRYAESLDFVDGLLTDRIKTAKDEAEKNEELARTYGMSAAAIAQEEVARLKNQLARANEEGLALSEIEHLKEMIKLRERSAAALASVEAKDANAKAAEQAAKDWERSSEQIGQSLVDNIMRGGKSAAEYLKDLFRTLVLRPILQPIGNAVGGFVASATGAPGVANAGTGTAGGQQSLTQSVSQLYNAFKAGGSFEGSVAKGVQAGLDKLGLSQGSGAPGSLAQGAGVAASYLAGGAVGIYGGRAISNGYGSNSAVNVGTAAGGALGALGLLGSIGGPLGAALGGVIGGLANRAFGMKAKEVTGTTLNGTFGLNGFLGSTDTAWKQEGGWFRSDKSGVDKVAVDAAMSKQLSAAYDAIKVASADFASVLGINADSIKTRAQALSIALTKDEEANKKAIADFFVGVGDTIAKELLPSLTDFQKEGEAASGTLERLATNYAMIDTALESINKQFGALGVASLSARERLIEAAGGLEAFAANTAGFQQNFLTEAERNAPVLKAVTEQMAALGLAGVGTRDEFKQVVMGLDLTTEAGAKQYGALMQLQAAFAQVYPVLESTADAAAAAAAKLGEVNKGYQDQINEILRGRMSSAELRAADTMGMDPSTIALYDRLAALRLESIALEKAAAESKSLQEQYDELTLTRRQQADKEREALEPANRARWDEIQAIKAQQSASEKAAAAIRAAAESSVAAVKSFGDGLLASMNRARDGAKALREFSEALPLGNLSTLDPDAKYRAAKQQFEAADPSDTAAAQAFLQASKDRGADSFYYERDFAMVQKKLAEGAAALDRYADSLPSFWLGYLESMGQYTPPVVTQPVAPPVVQQTATMSKSSAQQADITRLEAKVDGLTEALGDKMEIIANSTADTARNIAKVTNKGNGMVLA